MNPVEVISSLPSWVQFLVYLSGIVIFIGLILLIIGFTLGSAVLILTKAKATLASIFYFGLGIAGKIGNPAIEMIYKKSLEFRNGIVNKHLIRIIEIQGNSENKSKKSENGEIIPLWEKFPANIRTDDGHIVRSNPEKMIDDWFSKYRIFHHYEQRLPFPGIHYCDFYLPEGDVYIEYWGLDSESYNKRKNEKIRLYSEYNLRLISIEEADLRDIDHFLQERLRRYGYLPPN